MRLNWLQHRYIIHDGYGRYGLSLVRELIRQGVDIRPLIETQLEVSRWLWPLMNMDFSHPTLSLMPGHHFVSLPGRQVAYSMYECTRIPDDWAENINDTVERLLVPCEHNAEVFADCGVKVPIKVVHGGCDGVEFPYLDRPLPTHRPYTFLALGDRGNRKGMDTVWVAFWEQFGDNPDVRLIIKTRHKGLPELDLSMTDRRVSIWRGDVDTLADVFAQVDCFVFPTTAEGWGLPPREAALMGLPVIATRYSGTAVGTDQWAIPIEHFKLVPAPLGGKGGLWAKPDRDEVGHHMKWCYENRETAREKGRQAARWLREHQTWAQSAQALRQIMEA